MYALTNWIVDNPLVKKKGKDKLKATKETIAKKKLNKLIIPYGPPKNKANTKLNTQNTIEDTKFEHLVTDSKAKTIKL